MVSNETPYKLKSSSPYSSLHTHDKVDPRLVAELEHHIWHTRDASFFDRFFPNVDRLPTPSTVFPPDPQQHAVIKWFNDYHDVCRQWQKDRNLKEGRWILKTSPNRPLHHPTTDRKLDMFLYDGGLEFGDAEVVESSSAAGDYGRPKAGLDMEKPEDWKHVIVIAELKCEKRLGDLNRKVVLQLADYARYVFQRQPDRQWVHGFSVINATLRCWLYTRSGAFASSPADLTTNNGIAIFQRVFNGYLNMTGEQHGIAASMTANPTIVGNKTIVRGPPFFTTHSIVTRGTTCWTARPLDDNSEWPWVLKVSWRYTGRKHEGVMLADCQNLPVPVRGIAEYIAHDEGIPPVTVHGVLGQRCIDAAVALDLQWWRNKQPSPYSTPATSFRQKQSKVSHALGSSGIATVRTPSNTSNPAETPTDEHRELEVEGLVDTMEIPVPDRIYTRVLLKRGKPIDDFSSPVELLLAMRDAVRGHESLLVVGHVLHRDVSVNNILITLPSVPRSDGFHGFLLDLDHAITTDTHHSGAPERTGTFEFMSTRALGMDPGFHHGYYDDLQSFMWVFFWLITLDRSRRLAVWSNPSPEIAMMCKIAVVTTESDFKKTLVPGFDPCLGTAVMQAAADLRNAVWPAVYRNDLDAEPIRDSIYQAVIHAFDNALVIARKEADTLKPRVLVPRDRMAY